MECLSEPVPPDPFFRKWKMKSTRNGCSNEEASPLMELFCDGAQERRNTFTTASSPALVSVHLESSM